MILDAILFFSIMIFAASLLGYLFSVIKEKLYLKNNVVLIENKNLDSKDLEKVDIKHFMLGTTEVMAGDEVKIHLENSATITGTVLGVIKGENSISIITSSQGVKNLNVRTIKKLKVVSRYGKFFSKF